MKKEWCVYGHYKADSGELFYIGMGKKYRMGTTKSRNPFWKNIVLKHGFTFNCLKSNLSQEEAFALEIMLIKMIGKRIDNSGILCNITDGGPGNNYKGPKYKARGKKQSKERIEQRLYAIKGQEVLQYSLEGEFIREWSHANAVNKVFNKNCGGNILLCCKGYKSRTVCQGFQWKYKTKNYPLKIDSYIPMIYKLNYPAVRIKDLTTNIVYESYSDASRKLNIEREKIINNSRRTEKSRNLQRFKIVE